MASVSSETPRKMMEKKEKKNTAFALLSNENLKKITHTQRRPARIESKPSCNLTD